MNEYSNEIKIPKERIAVLIGKNGESKKQIEEESKIKLTIDSQEGVVVIHGSDALAVFSAVNVVKAIARGFNPEIALLLLRIDYVLEIIPVLDFAKNKSQIQRLKGRVIGQNGKARENVERLTETHISVYGKTIALIGLPDYIALARKAMESLLNGSPHATVYRWLERQRKDVKRREFESSHAITPSEIRED